MKVYRVFGMVLAVVLFLSNSCITYAAENVVEAEVMKEDMEIIEEELRQKDTSVCNELEEIISDLENKKNQTTDKYEIEKIQALIDTTNELKGDYLSYSDGIAPIGVTNPIYSPMVAAVIAYFGSCGYELSCELLIHARDNNRLDSVYSPVNGNRINASGVVGRLKSGKNSTSGSGVFENTGSTVEKDLYYAIHCFNYTFDAQKHIFTLTDRYDYAFSDEYTGVAGVAVNEMFLAQQNGVLVPYYVKIVTH